MKYVLGMRSTTDELFLPWDIIVANTKHKDVLTVQDPSPFVGDNLIGFEREFEKLDVTVHEPDWTEKCIGLHPVFAANGGMYSVRELVVDALRDRDAIEEWDGTGLNPNGESIFDEACWSTASEDGVITAHVVDRRYTAHGGFWVTILGNEERGMEDIVDQFGALTQSDAMMKANAFVDGFSAAYRVFGKG